MNIATVPTYRCPGWRHKGHEGHGPHTLPATLEYFWADRYQKDGLGKQCKSCQRAYRKYSQQIWNEERAARKARNEAGIHE